MQIIYANSFMLTTNGENEIFLTFNMNMPEYENDEFKGMKTKESIIVVLSKEGYDSFRKMIDKAETKEEN